MQDTGYVNLEIRNKIAIITFYHIKSNSLPSDLLEKLANTIEEAGNNSEIKVIILQSYGEKSFCAGASFDELININDFDTGKKFFMGFANVINAIRKAPKFVITKIQGKAVGGGVGIIAASDYAMAYKESSIKLSEFSLGIGPFVIGPAVERKIGKTAFSQMSIDTEWRDSNWAFSRGLYSKIFDTIEELNEFVHSFAEKSANLSIDATYELKKMFWKDTVDWDILLEKQAEISGRLVLSEFTKKYFEQFKQK